MHTLSELSQQLKHLGINQPTLVIDANALDQNIAVLNEVLSRGFHHRLVVKSLPCPGLIDYISGKTQCTRLMCFHTPFLLDMLSRYPNADILLGKPLAASNAAFVIQRVTDKSSIDRVQWLIDTPERLQHYEALAQQFKIKLRINLEIDIGLHRGGFELNAAYEQALRTIASSAHLEFSGLMGYEAHASKIPSILGGMTHALKAATETYAAFKAIAKKLVDTNSATFNTGGSTTFTQHHDSALFTELSVGSALVKPSDFDLTHMRHVRPAAYVATPIVKQLRNITIPGPKALSTALRLAGQLPPQAAYIYGGNWKANPVYPESAEQVSLFGRSSNQELYGFKKDEQIKVDDIMLFRPTQSEAVLLQFGDIALLRDGKIEQWWPVLTQGDNPASETIR